MTAYVRTVCFVLIIVVSAAIATAALEHRGATKAIAAGVQPNAATCKSAGPCLVERNGGHGPGLTASSAGGAAIRGTSQQFDGVFGQTFNDSSNSFNTAAGVEGSDQSTDPAGGNPGVWGNTIYGAGVFGATYNDALKSQQGSVGVIGVDQGAGDLNIGVQGIAVGTAMLAVSLGQQQPAGQQQFPALDAVCTGGSLAMLADNGYGSPIGDVMSLDCSGNMILKGSLLTDSPPLIRVGARGSQARAAYADEQTVPAIEDDGEARIVGGSGYVSIDAAFAQAADVARGYSVFLTPEGPSQGLYVTAKNTTGFQVRENPGGHASIGFAYRIVASPLGSGGSRLPDMASVRATLYREGAAAPHDAAYGKALELRFKRRTQPPG